jgi:hypothetical protein
MNEFLNNESRLKMFEKFFSLVEIEANKLNRVFYINCEEGYDEIIDGILYMDLSGWLIDKKDEEDFLKYYKDAEEPIASAKDLINVT